LRNDGTDPINGTFLNAPENGIFGGALNTAFRITYQGGDGNDIVITRVNRAQFDFDGDGKSDVSVFRPSSGIWYLNQSIAGFRAVQFGTAGDRIVPADYDGDNKTDVAVFRPSNGTWYYLRSSDNTFTGVNFGTIGDIPVPNDYDGDGRADLAVFRPSNGTWYQLRSIANQQFAQTFGQNGDTPLVGDFDGDGLGDLGVFRGGNWFLFESASNSFRGVNFGLATDKPAPADYDGDGKTDVAVSANQTELGICKRAEIIMRFRRFNSERRKIYPSLLITTATAKRMSPCFVVERLLVFESFDRRFTAISFGRAVKADSSLSFRKN
jgi:hypothetical protein